LNYKSETSEAIKRVERIIWEWEENWLDAREALELLVPDIKTIICYVESIQDEVNEGCYKKRNRN
jgi:hypothetical protein